MAHKHDRCGHDLKYCNKCDVVYCLKCDKEWGGHQHYCYHPWWTGSTYTEIPCSTIVAPWVYDTVSDTSSTNIYAATTTPHDHVCCTQ